MTSSENFIFDSRKQNFANIIHVQCTIVIPLSFSPSFILVIGESDNISQEKFTCTLHDFFNLMAIMFLILLS
jgi:hypothetical protein